MRKKAEKDRAHAEIRNDYHRGYRVVLFSFSRGLFVKMRLTALATLIVVLKAGGVSGQMDCPEITEAVLEDVIRNNIPTEDSPATPTLDILRLHPECLAYSQERDRYRYVSVVVEYTCTSNANCPSGTAVEQIHSECSSGTWIGRVARISPYFRTINPTANFSTTTREDCVFFFSPMAANALALTTDTVTHCVGMFIMPHMHTCIC